MAPFVRRDLDFYLLSFAYPIPFLTGAGKVLSMFTSFDPHFARLGDEGTRNLLK